MYHKKFKLRFLMLIAVYLFSGCIAKQIVPASTSMETAAYRSENFIVHQKQSTDTYESIAKLYFKDKNRVDILKEADESLSINKNKFFIIPLKEKHLGGIYKNGFQKIPILCYHKFGEKTDSKLNISAKAFDAQMKYLKDNNFNVITLNQFLNFIEYKRRIPRKSVVITIDDGFRSGFNVALPILSKYGFKAVFFVYTNYIGVSKKAITWENLRQLKKRGHEIGSHTINHYDLTEKLDGENHEDYFKRIKKEIFISKKILDKKLNQDTLFFSLPYGRTNPEVKKLIKSAGYKMGVTVQRGSNPFYCDPFNLNRDMILNKSVKIFAHKLQTFNYISLR
ncbi:MAG: polysaccharide deacetylase family protein [Desulfobacula sp.]|nr:polysaccharide deacetylase family protein [Desulfobacula sp.]